MITGESKKLLRDREEERWIQGPVCSPSSSFILLFLIKLRTLEEIDDDGSVITYK